MTRWIVLAGSTLVVYFLQTTVLPSLLLYRFRIDLLLLWVVAYALLTGPKRGLAFGLAVGLFMDLTVFRPFGLSILCKGFAGYLAGNLARKFFREQLAMPLIIEAAAIACQELFLIVYYRYLTGIRVEYDLSMVSEQLLVLVYSLIFAAWIYRVLAQLVDWLDRTAAERSEQH